ncbi:hypothetical protein GWN43_04805, partial [Candidatus Bathyarchaeota archaeon]|nr:hypothetical protein [Candidatus Bathyarchaeota archaeon]NIV68151.1 hypothetical protein [Candidatus Bathyarchaeota archaeon]
MAKMMALKRGDLDSVPEREEYTVTILGDGQRSLTDACLFADAGFKVICAGANHWLQSGGTPSTTPQLSTHLDKHVKTGRLTTESDIREATAASDIIISHIPAAIDNRDRPDYSPIEKTCREVGLSLRKDSLFILSSTIGPGITENLVKETLEKASGLRAGTDFGLAYSPIHPSSSGAFPEAASRRVIGAIDHQSLQTAYLVLDTVMKEELVQVRDIKTAETANLLEKIYAEVKIALANELADFCEGAGIDLLEVQRAIDKNPHSYFLPPQLVSDSEMAEAHLLNYEAEALNTNLRMLTLTQRINRGMLGHTVHLVKDALRACGKNLRRAKITVFGASLQPKNEEDIFVKRLTDKLKKQGAHVWVIDPLFSHQQLLDMGYRAERALKRTVENSDCLVMAAGQERFSHL